MPPAFASAGFARDDAVITRLEIIYDIARAGHFLSFSRLRLSEAIFTISLSVLLLIASS